MYTKRGS